MKVNNMQAMVDGLAAGWQRERAETQMTLGKMIKELEGMPKEIEVDGLGGLDSYRGYYCDLAFSPEPEKMPVADVLAACKDAMGKAFEGYKGGEFVMGEHTPLWLAPYGDCGKKIIGINADGTIETVDDD